MWSPPPVATIWFRNVRSFRRKYQKRVVNPNKVSYQMQGEALIAASHRKSPQFRTHFSAGGTINMSCIIDPAWHSFRQITNSMHVMSVGRTLVVEHLNQPEVPGSVSTTNTFKPRFALRKGAFLAGPHNVTTAQKVFCIVT